MKKTQPAPASRTSSRKKITNQQPQRKNNQPNPSKQQNIHQFKMEIDHEIAKCLDTLDRRGLKYLRETLRNSNVFNEEIREVVIAEKNKEVTSNNNKKNNKNKNNDQIQQEIVQQYDTFLDDTEDPSKQKTKLGPNTSQPLKQQKIIPVKLQKFQDKIQQPLKPFAKRAASKQGNRASNQQQKAMIVQKLQSKTIKQQQNIKDKSQIDMLIEKINQLPDHKLKELGKIIDRLQKSQKISQQQLSSFKSTRPYMLKPDQSIPNQSSMRNSAKKDKKNQKATSLYNSIIKGNKKVSPNVGKQKQQERQFQQSKPKYQQRDVQINQNQISQQISEIQLQNQINQPKVLDVPDQIGRYQNINVMQKQKQQVKTNNQKINEQDMGKKKNSQSIIKKSSFIKNFPISNIKKPLDIEVTESHQADTLQLNSGNQSKMVRLGKKKLGTNKVKIVLLRNRGHPTIIGLTSIQLYNTASKLIPITLQNLKSQSSPKLMRLFNGIHNTTNQQEMFTTVFKRDFEIELQIPEKIGGMRVWNYNKSEIESSKETDWIQLYINDRLAWEGYIKKGSYNEITQYSTDAEIQEGFKFENIKKLSSSQNRIQQFSQTPGSSQNLKIQGSPTGGTYTGKPKQKQKQKQKVNWLQKTLLQQKIKQIQQQNKKFQTTQIKNNTTKLNRFSQLYSEQDNYASNLGISSRNFRQTKFQNKQPASQQILIKQKSKQHLLSKQKQVLPQTNQKLDRKVSNTNVGFVQRATRTNSQRIQQQKDIFSSFGQSLLKQKIKANEINAKVNEISQKVQKFKETIKNKQDFGYASLLNNQSPELPKQSSTKLQLKQIKQIKQQKQPKQKKNYQKQSLDDFMNDSLFQDPPKKTVNKPTQKETPPPLQSNYASRKSEQRSKYNSSSNTNTANKVDIDDILNQLNDVVGTKQNRYQFGNQKQKSITIPQLPKGNKLELLLLSNWGDPQLIGLNKIQFFDNQGQKVYPSQAKSSTQTPVTSLFSQSRGYLNEQGQQWKCAKREEVRLWLSFSRKVEFSMVRVWNYVGDRVRSMVGVKRVQILLDGALIFAGDVRKNAGNNKQQIFKSCQCILYTNNVIIQKRIAQNDWFTQQLQSQREQTIIFRKTIQNFSRPITTGLVAQKQQKISQNKQPFKLPKRNCQEYDPPTLPSGYYVKLILHTTWGDRDFVGLNGVVVYDEKGEDLTGFVKKISEFPAPLGTLAGYQGDKRVLNNLFNGKNVTSSDESIWLAPYLRDVDKMQKQAQNAILIQFQKQCTISGINIYNYTKTPTRGVRQLQLHIDHSLAYRGYIRMANIETGELRTTINFTKDAQILEKIGYVGYNEDGMGQEVGFWNQGRVQKAVF